MVLELVVLVLEGLEEVIHLLFLQAVLFVNAVDLLTVGVLDVGDGAGVVLEHGPGPPALLRLRLHLLVLSLKLPDDGQQPLDCGHELLEGGGKGGFLRGDPEVVPEDGLCLVVLVGEADNLQLDVLAEVAEVEFGVLLGRPLPLLVLGPAREDSPHPTLYIIF